MPLLLSRGMPLVVGLALLVLPSCSSDIQQDQNYGSDIGLGYKGPDGGFPDAPTTQSDADPDAADASDAASDAVLNDANDANIDPAAKDTTATADATLGLRNAARPPLAI